MALGGTDDNSESAIPSREPARRVRRKSDGRRVFTVEFKRGVVQQLRKGDKTLAEVSGGLDIQPSVVRQWKRRFEAGATAAVASA
jgi:transposase-like protein